MFLKTHRIHKDGKPHLVCLAVDEEPKLAGDFGPVDLYMRRGLSHVKVDYLPYADYSTAAASRHGDQDVLVFFNHLQKRAYRKHLAVPDPESEILSMSAKVAFTAAAVTSMPWPFMISA